MKIVIIGAGPAGIMAAISAKIHNLNSFVTLLEKNNQIGMKLRLTGGGRCNVTANLPNEDIIENIPKNGRFLFSSLTNFNSYDIQSFFIKEGCPLSIEDHNRVFPASNQAIDIVNVLYNKINTLNINLKLNTNVLKIDKNKRIITTNNELISYDYLIIATGGITYPNTGSDGFGYELAKSFGHTITDLLPAEVPLVSNEQVIQDKTLQGLSFNDVKIDIFQNKKKLKSITHDLIITHFGISGPAALRASYYIHKILVKESPIIIHIDFLPRIGLFELNNLKDEELPNYILSLLPKRLFNYLKTITVNNEELINKLKSFPLSIYTTKGFKQAFVTEGGVSINEIDPKTMKSKLDNSLSFCGEIIDISGFTGGFNITAALSTGYTAGKYLSRN